MMADEETRQMPRSTVKRPVNTKSGPPPSNRKQGVLDLIGVTQIPLAAMATFQTVREPDEVSVYALDIVAIDQHKDDIADAIVDLANANPVLGAILDKVAATSPFAGLIASVMTLGLQIAENHGLLPGTSKFPGVMPREELADAIRAHGESIAANGADN